MIVKDSAIYAKLFERANDELKIRDTDKEIITVEDYFGRMLDLVSKDRRFARLPLDEPAFEIDANTRTINIPNEFKLNGISVQGDESAEYIYFKIDRFFDAQDFNEAKILIQWQAPGINNTPGDSGIDLEWVRDIESEPGKLIFGWRITSDVTKIAGTIKFAIRFIITKNKNLSPEDENEIIYSFSTLTASATIKPSLDFSIFNVGVNSDETSKDIALRFTNSQVITSTPAATPIFITSFEESYDIENNGYYPLKTQVYRNDTGIVTYEWKKEGYPEILPSYDSYEQILSSAKFEPLKNYYKMSDAEEVPAYIPTTVTENSFDADVIAGLYERYNICNIETAGNYYVTAKNSNKKSSITKRSEIASFPTPNEEKFTVNKLNVNKEHTIQETESGFEVPITASAVVENPDKELLSYEWYEIINNNENKIIEDANSNIFKASHIGKYFSKVYNTRNNVSVSKNSDVIWISLPAEKPVIIEGNDFNNDRYPIGKNIEVSLTGRFTSNRYESYKIFWYKMQGEGPNPGDNTDDILIPSATNSFTLKTEGLEPGQYYVAIQSVYNDNVSDFLITNPFNLY